MANSADDRVRPRERRVRLTGPRLVALAVVLAVGGLAGYLVWQQNAAVHAGDTHRVVLTRGTGCQEADPLYIDGWAWTGSLPFEYGNGPVPGQLRVDSTEKRTATFVADVGWSAPFRGDPSGFSDLSCTVPG